MTALGWTILVVALLSLTGTVVFFERVVARMVFFTVFCVSTAGMIAWAVWSGQ